MNAFVNAAKPRQPVLPTGLSWRTEIGQTKKYVTLPLSGGRTAPGLTPQAVHEDRWHILGCPVNGPAVAAAGEQVAVAWFTAAQNTPRIKLSFSIDEGQSFGTPVQIDDGFPIGRLDTILLQEGSALVSWIENIDDGAEIRVRRVHADGTPDASSVVAGTSTSRASGVPRISPEWQRPLHRLDRSRNPYVHPHGRRDAFGGCIAVNLRSAQDLS